MIHLETDQKFDNNFIYLFTSECIKEMPKFLLHVYHLKFK
jgi:hypothetical protein